MATLRRDDTVTLEPLGETSHPAWKSDSSAVYLAAKRALDLAAASVLLGLFAPFWLIIAALIRLDSRGPALFRQQRVGLNGRLFTVYKFRSMRSDADDAIHRRYVEAFISDGAPSESQDGQSYFKLRQDPRITRVGRFLRKTSLDEIPQLLNVVRGEMSLVGPRPALPWEVERYEPWQTARLLVKPGITGYWQVHGRSRVTFEQMVRMDLHYVRHASLRLDLVLLLQTLPAVLSGAGAD